MENYFEFLDNASVGRSYDWTSLHIDLNFNKTEIDLESILNGTLEFGDTQNEAVFIHEYVHYLQNFYCNWGGLVFCNFVLALEKMGASKVSDSISFKLPLKIKKIEGASLWNDGVILYEKFGNLLGSSEKSIVIENLDTSSRLSIKSITDDSLVINNGRISYCIDNKTIREHMADLSSMLFLNYTDEQVYKRLLNTSSLCSTLGTLDKQPMYWMLFEYFFDHKYKNVSEGLVILCHSSLCSANPLQTIIRFFKFIEKMEDELKGKNDLLSIVNGFLNIQTEVLAFSFSFNAALQNIIEQLKLCSKHSDHSFYESNSILFNHLMFNIYSSFSAKLIFRNPQDLRNKKFWIQTINKTGTPIIRYKDKMPIIISKNNDLIDSLTYFLGVTKVIENLQDNYKLSCPFHTDFNICKTIYKNNDNCLYEPLLVKNPLCNGEECLFQNALELMGLTDRIIMSE